MKKKNSILMAVDEDFKNYFKKVAADRGKSMIDLSRELADSDPDKMFRVFKAKDSGKKKKVRGLNYGFN